MVIDDGEGLDLSALDPFHAVGVLTSLWPALSASILPVSRKVCTVGASRRHDSPSTFHCSESLRQSRAGEHRTHGREFQIQIHTKANQLFLYVEGERPASQSDRRDATDCPCTHNDGHARSSIWGPVGTQPPASSFTLRIGRICICNWVLGGAFGRTKRPR